MQTLLSIFVFCSLLLPPSETLMDVTDDVVAAIKTGNASNVAKFFSESIDMKIMEKEDVYSKAQAELIIKDFFAKNPLKAFSVLHKSTAKNGDQSVIGTYESAGKKFRVYFLIKKGAAKSPIQQLRIDPQDE